MAIPRSGNKGARCDGKVAVATQTRGYDSGKTPKERSSNLKPGRGIDNPVK